MASHPTHPPTAEFAAVTAAGAGSTDPTASMSAAYRARFSPAQIDLHRRLLGELSPDRPARVHADRLPDGSFEATVAGYDFPGELGIICGLFTAFGLSIREGVAFTAAEPAPPAPAARPPGPRRRSARPAGAIAPTRKIVDVFRVDALDPAAVAPDRADFEGRLCGLLAFLRAGDLRAAREALIEPVCAVLRRHFAGRPPTLMPMRIELDNDASPTETVLRIASSDSPAFLFQLLTALSMRGLYVRWVRIETHDGRIEDTLGVTDSDFAKLDIAEQGEALRAAVALVRQFTHLLPLSPNPQMALRNFGLFLDDALHRENWAVEIAALQDPQALPAIAKLMGVSEFLWEDFLRLQHEHLLPMVTQAERLAERKPSAAMRAELRAALAAVPDGPDRLDRQCGALNDWKDREMFRIDMRHILGRAAGFTEFSAEMSDLAETAVAELFELLRADRTARHGAPRLSDGRPCRLCLCALGKAGGREMGVASDIELMLVYNGEGRTDGAAPVASSEFAIHLINELAGRLRPPREGIFEVDLRLRPFGEHGPAAVSREAFATYYRGSGPGPAMQRQALVRLRPIAGEPDFAAEVIDLRDRVLYEGPPPDVAALLHIRRRAATELVAPGAVNVKIGRGGLVDIEYAVQALQAKFGREYRALRTPNILEALTALGSLGLLAAAAEWKLRESYLFLRRLIDALRIVRGHAKDLCLPAPDSAEFAYLARRMGYSGDRAESVREKLARDIERTMETARRLTTEIYEREFPGALKAEGSP